MELFERGHQIIKTPQEINRFLEQNLLQIQKPARYTGGEYNQVLKDWGSVNLHVALVFPDIYDLGMSNLGLTILYDLLNKQKDIAAERAFAPWLDMEAAMRKSAIPLYSLETKHPLSDFDILGFTLPYETLFTNTLNILDLSGIPLRSSERDARHPLIIAGGHAAFNPEPMHAFVDAFVIGEGEEVILEIMDAFRVWKASGATRHELLKALAQVQGVYIPAFYETKYKSDGTLSEIAPLEAEARLPILKRMVAQLPPPPTHFIVPYIDTAHNRVPIEIMRGCTRGCRFCHAGMINRPVRERPVEEILAAIDEALASTGYEEVGLLSLSSSDYSQILELVNAISEQFCSRHLNISLPSLRIESFSVELMDALRESRRSGFTLAPEAATDRMRKTINKPVSSEQLLETAREVFSHGWHTLKLYFMIGHPSETIEDVEAIIDLCKQVLAEGRKVIGKRAQVTASVSTFIPKAHTPFQWVPCDTIEQIREKQALLKHALRGSGFKLNWNTPEDTMLEAWLSRGDRRLSEVIFQAWMSGAKFDAWKEHFRYEVWQSAFDQAGLDPAFYTHRERSPDEYFPWDHISTGVRKDHLRQEYLSSLQGEIRQDCRENCYACGILPVFAELRRENPGSFWKCPEISPKKAVSI